MQHLGQTRSTRRQTHLLHTPDAFVRAPLPGMERGMAVIHISPVAGAGFMQYTAELEDGGCLGSTSWQRFMFMVSGEIEVAVGQDTYRLSKGGYGYLPQEVVHSAVAIGSALVAVIEKPYVRLDGVAAVGALFGFEEEINAEPVMGDEGLQVRSLLPADRGFDFAMNTLTYAPGVALPLVEVHVMEHGLLMLDGGGIYRLGDNWYPVTAGDFIWMAAYCPQWFGALGKVPAKYLLYKDWNRSTAVLPTAG
ncbi:MAG TPA: (S)-ureidoglycine aminohydrolase [Acidisarcina sp.]